jgi:hypothetical protein
MSGGRALRISSLLPSTTEIVASLGQNDWLVGRSAECDFPPSVPHLPVVTSARVDTGANRRSARSASRRSLLTPTPCAASSWSSSS